MNTPPVPEPAPEVHREVGNEHDAVWAVTDHGAGTPAFWSCTICHVPNNDGEPLPTLGT